MNIAKKGTKYKINPIIPKLNKNAGTGPILRADFTLYGSFARTYRGHGTDRALIAGVL
ncbi:MAG: hypothetical protein HFJ53_05860, partial [Clostridia bacterium]|nr:hypothetical protein [Clostridia bacterium]